MCEGIKTVKYKTSPWNCMVQSTPYGILKGWFRDIYDYVTKYDNVIYYMNVCMYVLRKGQVD